MPKISIVVPVYNVEQYLKEALDSLVNQTMKDLEFVCVDDGSTDKSLEILKQYAEKDPRFVIISQQNQGAGIARNNGLKAVSGKYVTYLDPDDWFELNAMEVLYQKLQETNAVALQFDWINRYDNEYSSVHKSVEYSKFADRIKTFCGINIAEKGFFDWCEYKSTFFNFSGGTWGRIYLTSFIKENNIRSSEIPIGEDRLFGVMSLFYAPKVYYCEKFLYNYRIRSNSLCRRQSEKYFYCPFICYDEIEEFFKSKNCFDDFRKQFNQSKIGFFKMIYYLLPKNKRKEYKNLCRKRLSRDLFKNIFRLKQSFIKNIFSVENSFRHDGLYKQIVLFGFSIEIKKNANLQRKSL